MLGLRQGAEAEGHMRRSDYRELSSLVLGQKGYLEVSNPGRLGPLRVRVMKQGKCYADATCSRLDDAADLCFEQMREHKGRLYEG